MAPELVINSSNSGTRCRGAVHPNTYDHRYERCRRPVCNISRACDRRRTWRRRWLLRRWLRIQRRIRIPWWVWLRISRRIPLLLRRLWLVGARRGARPWAGGDRRRPVLLPSSAVLLSASASVLSAATTDLQSGAGRRRPVLLRGPIRVPDGSSGRDGFRLLLPGQQRSEGCWSGQLIDGSFRYRRGRSFLAKTIKPFVGAGVIVAATACVQRWPASMPLDLLLPSGCGAASRRRHLGRSDRTKSGRMRSDCFREWDGQKDQCLGMNSPHGEGKN